MKNHIGKEVQREDIRTASKVLEWARPLRSLREEGWDIETTKNGYILHSDEKGFSLKSRKPINNKLRYFILQRDESKCQRCGLGVEDGVKLEVDHKRPVDWGGSNDEENLWVLCADCNGGKKNLFADLDKETMKQVLMLDSGYERLKMYFILNPNVEIEPVKLELVTQIRDWERTLRSIRKKENMKITWITKSKSNPKGAYIYVLDNSNISKEN